MVLHYIWTGFILIAFLVALIRVIGYYYRDFFAENLHIIFDISDREVFKAIVDSTFEMSKVSVSIAIGLIGIMALWLGIMKIGELGGAVRIMARLVGPFFNKLFPEIPKNHPSFGSMLMNISANMLGLDNAATPLGLKAMKELQEVNPSKDTASNAQIMFLVLNTSGLTIIPVSIMAIRASAGAANPTDIFIPILFATACATLAGLISVSIFQRINLFNKVVLSYILGIAAVIIGSGYYLSTLDKETVQVVSNFAANFILFSIITSFVLLALKNKVNMFDAFVDGAKEGFEVAIKIIPYLVAMLVAIGIFRASGAFDFVLSGITKVVSLFSEDTEFVHALPTALMKPLSGSGARGMMVEAINNYGVDSFIARLAGTFQGSTETTFYTLAVYFSVVNIKRTRHTVTCGLIADFTGIIAAIYFAHIFFK